MTPEELAAAAVPEEESEQVAFLRQENQRLSSALKKLRNRQEGLYEATFEAVNNAIRGIKRPSVSKARTDKRRGTSEVACPILGDWQLGKESPDYNATVCAERIQRFSDKVRNLTDIQRADHPVKEAHVWLIGDLIEGELIFPGQEHELDVDFFGQVLVEGPQILEGFLRDMESHFERVKVAWVLGNHGRIGGRASKTMLPRNNGDRMLYYATKQLMERSGSKVEWLHCPREYTDFYMIDEVGDTRVMLVHGDQIRGQMGLPYYGYRNAVQGWATGALNNRESFDVMVAGHYHTRAVLTFNHRPVYMNGSPESMNAYAQENMKAMSRPEQTLLFMHPKHGVTAEYPCWLD
jgi:predicted phosphodiesterase